MAADRLTIGQLARQSGCKIPTIRYYERIGLMPEPKRTKGNQRIYQDHHVQRLTFIRHGRELGFTLDDIKDLLRLSEHPDAPCDQADAIARRHLNSVRERIRRLKLLEGELARMTAHCGSRAVAECRVIEILSNHDKCLAANHPPLD